MAIHPRRLAFGGLLAMAGAVGIGRFIYTPILPPMVADLGLRQGEAGLLAGANFLGYLAGALAAALARLPGGSRGWLLTALLVSGLTSAAMGLATSFPLLALLRFAGGLASALVLVLAASLVLERLSAAGRGGLSAMHFAGVGVGIAVSAVVAGLAGPDWRDMWFAGGGLALLALPVVAWLIPPAEPAAAAPAPGPSSAGLWPLATAYGLFGFGYVVTATFIVAILRGSPGLETFEPLVWLLVGLAAIPSVALWTALGRRQGVRRAFAIAAPGRGGGRRGERPRAGPLGSPRRRTATGVESRRGAVAWALWASLRFLSPLIKPDVRISRIRLPDRLHLKAHGGGPRWTRRRRITPSSPNTTVSGKRLVPRDDTLWPVPPSP